MKNKLPAPADHVAHAEEALAQAIGDFSRLPLDQVNLAFSVAELRKLADNKIPVLMRFSQTPGQDWTLGSVIDVLRNGMDLDCLKAKSALEVLMPLDETQSALALVEPIKARIAKLEDDLHKARARANAARLELEARRAAAVKEALESVERDFAIAG